MRESQYRRSGRHRYLYIAMVKLLLICLNTAEAVDIGTINLAALAEARASQYRRSGRHRYPQCLNIVEGLDIRLNTAEAVDIGTITTLLTI